MDYPASLLTHLAQHKREVIGVMDDGIWKRNGRAYSHLLPEAERHRNLALDIQVSCLDYMSRCRKRLHRDFHHLNSSQAFALNIFYPFVSDDDGRRVLGEALGIHSPIAVWEFEAVPDPEEGTNFDLMLTLKDKSRVYVEVKLTESGFGASKPNDRRREKLATIYRPRLQELARAEALEDGAFFRHYQLLRNLSYVNRPAGSSLLLVFPKANARASQEASKFIAELIQPLAQNKVSIVHAEDLAVRLLGATEPGSLAGRVLRQVIEKYELVESTATTA